MAFVRYASSTGNNVDNYTSIVVWQYIRYVLDIVKPPSTFTLIRASAAAATAITARGRA